VGYLAVIKICKGEFWEQESLRLFCGEMETGFLLTVM
jgi:hypothetical protein